MQHENTAPRVKSRDIRSKLYQWGRSHSFCKRCGGKTMGNLFIVPSQRTLSVDHRDAYPVVWICDNDFRHISRKGFTRPVDFNMIYGEPIQDDNDVPPLDASDEIWEEYAQKQIDEENKKQLTR